MGKKNLIVEGSSNFKGMVTALVETNSFTQRQASWVAVKDGLFLKIPRKSSSVQEDMKSPLVRIEAEKEFAALSYLYTLSNRVLKPVAFLEDFSCLVFPNLTGQDLIDELKERNTGEGIKEAIIMLANIHKAASPHSSVSPTKLPVIGGFEVRNFRRDASGILYFFDPHKIAYGEREEDVARFIISLLMIHWGRHLKCSTWTNFSLDEIIKTYESASDHKLNRDRLQQAFTKVSNMRKSKAFSQSNNAHYLLRFPMKVYTSVFFFKISLWRKSNGI